MTLNERLLALAECWAQRSDRSVSTLSARVMSARDGKFFERLAGGAGCNVSTAERFFAFFREPANWPNSEVPREVGALLDGVDLGVVVHADTDTSIARAPSAGNDETASRREVSHA